MNRNDGKLECKNEFENALQVVRRQYSSLLIEDSLGKGIASKKDMNFKVSLGMDWEVSG